MAYDTLPSSAVEVGNGYHTGNAVAVTRDGVQLIPTTIQEHTVGGVYAAKVGKGATVVEGAFTAGGPVAGTGIQFRNASTRVGLQLINSSNYDMWAVVKTSATVDSLDVADRIVELPQAAGGSITVAGPWNANYQASAADQAQTPATRLDFVQVEFASAMPTAAIGITSISTANPAEITTDAPHGLTTGDTVVISGATNTDAAQLNKEWVITEVDGETSKFTIPLDNSGPLTLTVSSAVAQPAIGASDLLICAVTIPAS